MRVLVAEDDTISRRVLEVTLGRLGYDVVQAADGNVAWEELQKPDPPRMAVLDWMMPELDGVELCRRIRESTSERGYTYVVLLTAKGQKKDVIAGLDAGADDYLIKPFDPNELRLRLHVGQRILNLESSLAKKVAELEEAAAHVRKLQGLLPICMFCKKIRDDQDSWHRLETYLSQHSDMMFSHSLCDDCCTKHFPDEKKKIRRAR